MCLSKGLTAGTLPLAAVLTTEDVYQAFYDDYSTYKAFLHSHSFTGNPLVCATALATLDLFEQEDWTARNRRTAQHMWERVSALSRHPHVAEVRQQGMILAIEMALDPARRRLYPAAERRGLRVYRHALQIDGARGGVLLRPLGNVVYFMPPYIIDDEQVEMMARAAIEGIERATAD